MIVILDSIIIGAICLWLGAFLSDLFVSDRGLAALVFIGSLVLLVAASVVRIAIACHVVLMVIP